MNGKYERKQSNLNQSAPDITSSAKHLGHGLKRCGLMICFLKGIVNHREDIMSVSRSSFVLNLPINSIAHLLVAKKGIVVFLSMHISLVN